MRAGGGDAGGGGPAGESPDRHRNRHRHRPALRGASSLPVAASSASSRPVSVPAPDLLQRHRFYLQLRDANACRGLERRITALGGAIEIFLVKSVTHVVTDDPRCGSVSKTYHGSSVQKSADTIDDSVSPVPIKWSGGQRGVGYRSRTDAMLESVSHIPQSQTPTTLQQARLWHIPIWTLKKVENFLNNITTKVQKKIHTGGKILKGTFIKFESLDRRNRAIFKEFPEWPQINLMKENFGSPFVLLDQKVIKPEITTKQEVKISNSITITENDNPNHKNLNSPKDLSQDRKLRMTRKARLRVKERVENPPKQNGYCEICRTSYSILSDHERTTAHINFTKNCSNFLSLDSLINEGIDVESFLNMNKSNMPNPCLERRSLRNIIKLHQETETQNVQKQLQVLCNGNSDPICKQVSPRDSRRNNNINEQSAMTQPHFSPPIAGNNGHYLRSKGSGVGDDKMSPRELLRNGSISPRIIADKSDSKINGKIDDKEKIRYAHIFKGRKPRSIRWRRPSPESNPPLPDNQTYYKVVGMSTKLRSSNNFNMIQKDIEPVPPPSRHFNGDTDTGLVVKFRRVRRSELSVLSDEAENFMFPKKDDSDTTEDEIETSHYSNNPTSSEILTSPNVGPGCNIKEEVLSGDDVSQDSYNSDCVRRKGRRRTKTVPPVSESPFLDVETPESRPRQHSRSASPDANQNKTDPCNGEKDVEKPQQPPAESSTSSQPQNKQPPAESSSSSQPQNKCLKWEDGKLKVSPEVDSLVYTFEQVPVYEPWYETFRRQDEGRENSKSIAQYLGYYWKSPILPYEMGFLPPLKPNCCSLSQIKKPVEMKPGPARLYGTRGMKRKKSKLENIRSLSKNPRKSPREHASTLAILGSLIHKKKSKLSSSDDTKSLPSITEEEVSNDVPFLLKMPEVHVSEETKKLEEFFSDLYDDVEDYDSLIDNLDLSLNIEKPGKPNVIDLLQNYDQCESIEQTVKEIQDNMQQRGINQRKRKGYKFKKKNKTGWPAKKRIQAKKVSAVEDADSAGDASVLGENGVETETDNPMVLEEETCVSTDKLNQITNNCVNDNVKNQNINYLVLENNENSITSFSDVDDKVSDSSNKCKTIATDTDLSNSEEENLSNNIDLSSSKHCDSVEYSLSERISCSEEKSHSSGHDAIEMQPVVRVQKIDARTISARGARKLRSSGSQRRPRRHLHR
ncbi:DBF4-CDC7 kinase regulatory subunit chiffon isoform X2 [Arctopsyche grandis]|uniref:DBF4-CDC7 kinase regulatory subunit chiffon isoform X2 n=1 Tax=Arctopsyche grandis TaxID=121162 RepID=UPI00406D7D21